MSLINRMLQDLDARGVDQPLPSDVRPLPPAPRSRRPLVLGGLALALLAGGLLVHQLAPWPAPVLPASPPLPAAVTTVVPQPAPPPDLAKSEPLPPSVEAPKPVALAPVVDTRRAEANQRSRSAPSIAPSAEKKAPVEKPAKASAVDGDESVAASRRQPEALPRRPAVDQAPPAAGKVAKEPTIARSDSAASPRARRERVPPGHRSGQSGAGRRGGRWADSRAAR